MISQAPIHIKEYEWFFQTELLSLDRVRVLHFKWTVRVLAQDQFLLDVPLKLFCFVSLLFV